MFSLFSRYSNRNNSVNKLFKSKKAQFTLFIIIGLVIVIILGFLIYYISNLNSGNVNVNTNKGEIQIYTETCLEEISKQGVFILESSGGYINIPERYVLQSAYVDMGSRVPYWYYKGFERAPTRSEMETELAGFIDENLMTCLDGFDAFKKKYDVKSIEPSETEVIITDENVYVTTNLPITISEHDANELSQGSKTMVNEFSIDFRSVLGKNHKLAMKIMDLENEMSFLENYTDEMIAASDYLPFEGMEIGCSPKVWTVAEMKEYTKTLIMHNLNFIMFEGTSYMETGYLYYDKLYKIPLLSKREKDYKNTVIKTIYSPSWDTKFEVTPSKSGVVKSFEMKLGDILPVCMQTYHHRYTMEYPVVFQIVDKEHPDEPFVFSTPVMMKYSMANRNNEAPNFVNINEEFSDREFCQEKIDYSYFERDELGLMHVKTGRIINMKNELDIYALDMLEGFPGGVIAGANISYQCVESRCNLGNTVYPLNDDGLYAGGEPLYSGKVPDCLNGLVIAEKEGYHRGVTQYTVSKETNGDQVNVELYPLKNVEYGFIVVEEHNGVVSERGLKPNEKVILTLRNKNLTDYEETLILPSDIDYYKKLEIPLGEYDFEYELDVKLISGNTFLGGINLNWTPSTNELYSSSYITFYVLRKDPKLPPQTPEEWQEVLDYANENAFKYPPIII